MHAPVQFVFRMLTIGITTEKEATPYNDVFLSYLQKEQTYSKLQNIQMF